MQNVHASIRTAVFGLQVFFDTLLIYAQMLQKAEQNTQFLRGLVAKKGDKFVLCMQNCPQLTIAHFAICGPAP